MWDLIVSVPDHCLSFYFEKKRELKSTIYTYNDIYFDKVI